MLRGSGDEPVCFCGCGCFAVCATGMGQQSYHHHAHHHAGHHHRENHDSDYVDEHENYNDYIMFSGMTDTIVDT